jgi:hypothetical protein
MRNYEFMLTLASGFAPRPTEGSAAGNVSKLRPRAQAHARLDERVAVGDRDHVEGEVAKPKRAARP